MNLYALSALLAVIGDVFIGTIVLLKSKRSPLTYVYLLMSFAIATWAFGCFGESLFLNNYRIAAVFERILYSGAVFAPAIYLNVVYVIRNNFKRNSRILLFFYSIGLLFFLINWYAPFRATFFIEDINLRYGFRYASVPMLGWYVFVAYYSIVSTFCLVELILGYIRSSNLEKVRYQYYFIATFCLAIGGYMYLFLIADIYMPQIDNVFHFSYSLIMAYAITKHDVMNVSLVIKKGAAFVITGVFVLATLLVAIYYTAYSGILNLIIVSCIGLFWAFFAYPFHRFWITTAKRKFIKGYYDTSELLTKISDEITSAKNRKDIFLRIQTELDNTFEYDHSVIILCVRDVNNTIKFFDVMIMDDKTIKQLDPKSDLILSLKVLNEPIFVQYAEMTLKSLVRELGFKYESATVLLPFHSPELLEGVIIIAEKGSQQPYNRKDFNFFKQLINLTNAVFYKMTPYEIIEKKFQANQQRLHEAEIQLIRSKKIEAIANATRQTHHEIKTPLQIISLAVNEIPETPETSKYKKEIIEEVKRALEIVEMTLSITDIAKDERVQLVPVDIRDAITRCIKLLPASGYEIHIDIGELPKVVGMLNELQIVFTNLMNNAKEAMPKGGTITISGAVEDDYVVIRFSDTGIGIPDDMKSRVWGPYISGTPTSVGNTTAGRGWGLTIVHKIIDDHNGFITFESHVGKGTTFIIKLPAIKD